MTKHVVVEGGDAHESWEKGLLALQEGRYWEAHEPWEAIWRALEPSPAREATQALIQFCAACYKVQQAAEGIDPARMQRGMEALIDSGRGHIDAAAAGDGVGPSFELAVLKEAFEGLEAIWRAWVEGETIEDRVRTCATQLARRIGEQAVGRPVRTI